MSNIDSEHSWQIAQTYASQIGEVPSIFSACVRMIQSLEGSQRASNIAAAKQHVADAAGPLVRRSPSLQAIFYYAAETLYPTQLRDLKVLSVEAIIKLFDPQEVATLIAVVYLMRRTETRCDQDEWRRLGPKLQISMEVGRMVGSALNNFGPGYGMLLGSIRLLALGMFLTHDLKGFQQYRRHLVKCDLPFDVQFEEARWGCNHLEVSASLVQVLGFGLTPSVGLGVGQYGSRTSPSREERRDLDSIIATWKAAIILCDSLLTSAQTPTNMQGLQKLMPKKQTLLQLEAEAQDILQRGSSYEWIGVRKEELPESLKVALNMR